MLCGMMFLERKKYTNKMGQLINKKGVEINKSCYPGQVDALQCICDKDY
jgi:hypothetical protein